MSDTILKQIEQFADNAHGTQTRKYTPERYMVHPVRVMKLCREYTDDLPILAAALLHDVLEDTPVTADEMHTFLLRVMDKDAAGQTLQLVTELTDVYIKKDYPQLNRRARKAKELERLEKTSTDSQTIKYADIIDNSLEIVKQDPDFARIFLYECRTLLQKIDKGEQVLYKRAVSTVAQGIAALRTHNK